MSNTFYCATLVLWYAYHADKVTHVYDFDEPPDNSNPNGIKSLTDKYRIFQLRNL